MSDFHFLRPYLLWLILPFLLGIILLIRSKGSKTIWHNVLSEDLMPYILKGKNRSDKGVYCVAIITTLLMVIALAGPSWQKVPQPLLKSQSSLVIALDLSPAMDAEDIKPSRLKRALFKIKDLLKTREDGQTALLVFSGDPFVVTPLTDDVATIEAMLPVLETSMMPSSGHRADKAVDKAIELFTQAGFPHGSVLLVTATLSNDEMDKAMDSAKAHGVQLSVLAVASDETAPIPKEGGGFVTDDKGALIITGIAKENLNKLTTATHGVYTGISADDSDIKALRLAIERHNTKHSMQEVELKENLWHDQGYLFAIAALPLFALSFRRGFLVLLLFLIPYPLHALTWDDLWKTQEQQAATLFKDEKYAEARELFQSPDWKAASSYKMGDYETAAAVYANEKSVEALYNLGTTKAKQGDLQSAIEAYDNVLKEDPSHSDAKHNKKVIEEWLKKQQQQQKQDQNNDNKQQQDNDSQDQKNEEGQEQSKDEEQNESDSKPSKSSQDSNNSASKDNNEEAKDNEYQDRTDEEKAREEQKESYSDQVDKELKEQEEKEKQEPNKTPLDESNSDENDEQRKIDDRFLQRIKDDPAGLLRRKFLYQYQQQQKKKL